MATIRIVRPNEDASRVIGTLGYWVNVLPPRQVKWAKALQFWLGANTNFESWVLFGFPYDSEDVQPNASNALGWLEGATSKNIEFIGRALMEAYVASRNPGGISEIGLISVPAIPPTPSVEDVGSIFPLNGYLGLRHCRSLSGSQKDKVSMPIFLRNTAAKRLMRHSALSQDRESQDY